jgi:hypothetical protein
MSPWRAGEVKRVLLVSPARVGVAMLVLVLAAFGSTMGAISAFGQHSSSATLPCQLGGDHCINIGFTEAWLNGQTVDLEYSHNFFCQQPPESEASSRCEAGAASEVNPPSGPIVSPVRTLVAQGFTPPEATLQCPEPGRCIDHPHSIDLSRLSGSSKSEATLPAHSFVLVDNESFQSTWWPVIVVGVKNLDAWNRIVAARSETEVQACQTAGNCTPDIPTNLFLFFQVLGPGMSVQGPG